jgi:hypothetical protein
MNMAGSDDSHPLKNENGDSPSEIASLKPFYLSIISYGHANGPLTATYLDGAEQLTFSVRDVENPPVKLRKTYTGLSPRLRKEVFANSAAQSKLETIVRAVEGRMAEIEFSLLKGTFRKDGSPEISRPARLVVTIMCEEGKHRSVAFAEELSRRLTIGRNVTLTVAHRDLDQLSPETPDQSSPSNPLDTRRGSGSKKQRDQERRKGRSSAAKFVHGRHLGDDLD